MCFCFPRSLPHQRNYRHKRSCLRMCLRVLYQFFRVLHENSPEVTWGIPLDRLFLHFIGTFFRLVYAWYDAFFHWRWSAHQFLGDATQGGVRWIASGCVALQFLRLRRRLWNWGSGIDFFCEEIEMLHCYAPEGETIASFLCTCRLLGKRACRPEMQVIECTNMKRSPTCLLIEMHKML